jgi:hypothetical protein
LVMYSYICRKRGQPDREVNCTIYLRKTIVLNRIVLFVIATQYSETNV